MNLHIYVNEQIIDLYPGTVFQTSINSLDLSNLLDRKTKYTSTIKVPKTENNNSVIGILTYNDTSLKPYLRNSILIIQDGIEVFSGSCFLSEKAESYVLSGIGEGFDLFNQLKEHTVSDLDDSEVGQLSNAEYYSYRNGVNGLFAPLVNWGKLNNAPVFQLLNNDFSATIDGWDNEGNGTDWEYDSMSPVGAKGEADSTPTASKYFMNKSRVFYAGYKYRAKINIVVATDSARFRTYLYDGTNGYTQVGSATYAIGTYDIVVNFSPLANADGIGFRVSTVSSPSATSVKITEVLIESDYDSFIELSYPFYFPSFSYRKVLEDWIQKIAGIGINFNLTEDQEEFIDSLVLASVRDSSNYSENFINLRTVKAKADGTQVISLSSSPTTEVIELPIIIKTDYGSWVNDEYISPSESFDYYADINLTVIVDVTVNTGDFRIVLFTSIPGINFISEDITGTGKSQITLTSKSSIFVPQFKGLLMNGTGIYATIDGGGDTVSMTVVSAIFTVTPREYPQDEVVLYSNLFLPDISVYDLIKDYCVRTMSLVRVKNQTLEFMPVENIISNKQNAVDWTLKRHYEEENIRFELSGFAQENKFKDAKNGDFEDETVISVTNESLPLTKDYYTSFADSSDDEPVKSVDIANINAFVLDSEFAYNAVNSDYDFSVDEKLVFVKLRDSGPTDPVVKYGATTAATFKVGEYASWRDFGNLFFPGFSESIDRAKVLDRSYILNDVDVSTLDEFKLIYDTDSFFILLSINMTKSQPSKTKLLKVF